MLVPLMLHQRTNRGSSERVMARNVSSGCANHGAREHTVMLLGRVRRSCLRLARR